MAELEAVGFWSYAHADDEAEGGRILQLADLVKAQYAAVTGGDELRLFIDRDDLEWGDEWRPKIEEALGVITFFIPVVTPRYLKSPECRSEFLKFAGHAKSLGQEELLLPIHYMDVPALTEGESEDEVVQTIKKTQWVDWRYLRFKDEGSGEHREAVHKLAQKLVTIARTEEERPATPPEEEAGTEGEQLPYLDQLALAEQVMPQWEQTLLRVPSVLEQIADIVARGTQAIEASDQQGKGFAGRLRVSREVAEELAEPAKRLRDIGAEYASHLVQVDPAILILIREAEGNPDEYRDPQNGLRDLFRAVLAMTTASREASEGVGVMEAATQQMSKLSRDLRKPGADISAGLRHFMDGQARFDEWERRIRTLDPELEPEELAEDDPEDTPEDDSSES